MILLGLQDSMGFSHTSWMMARNCSSTCPKLRIIITSILEMKLNLLFFKIQEMESHPLAQLSSCGKYRDLSVTYRVCYLNVSNACPLFINNTDLA